MTEHTLGADSVHAIICFAPPSAVRSPRVILEAMLNAEAEEGTDDPLSPAAWRPWLHALKPGGHVLIALAGRDMDLLGMALRLAGFRILDAILVAGARGQLPILVGQRPRDGTVIETVLRHGTGAMNVIGAGVAPTDDEVILGTRAETDRRRAANLVHDGSAAVVEGMRPRRDKASSAHYFTSLTSDAGASDPREALVRHLLRLRRSDETGVAPGAETLAELFGGQPALILMDELAIYLRKVANRSGAKDQLTAFLTAIFTAVESSPRAAIVYTLAVGKDGRAGDAYSDENQFVADRMAEP